MRMACVAIVSSNRLFAVKDRKVDPACAAAASCDMRHITQLQRLDAHLRVVIHPSACQV